MAKTLGVLYLDKYFFDIYSELRGTVMRFPFAPEIVRDYDILDKDGFIGQLKLFIQQNNLQPVSLHLVLSAAVLFTKQVELVDPVKREASIQLFVDNVPFELVGSISIPTGNAVQVIATNKDMYQTIEQGFEESGFSVESVIPAILIKDVGFTNGMTADVARRILGAAESLREHNFLTLRDTAQQETKSADNGVQPEAKKNTRLFLLVGVFLVLLAVLGAVIFLTNRG